MPTIMPSTEYPKTKKTAAGQGRARHFTSKHNTEQRSKAWEKLDVRNSSNEFIMHTLRTDDNAKEGLTQFWELSSTIPCTPKDFKR